MANNMMPSPLHGASFVRFALDVVDLLIAAEPYGLDCDGFLQRYFNGNQPTSLPLIEYWCREFRRAIEYSCRHFDAGDEGWAWIRALPGTNQGQYFYHVVAIQDGGGVRIQADPASLARLEPFTTRRWLTQTRSRMRVRSSEGIAMLKRARETGDTELEGRAQGILNEFIMLSPRLAAINFDTGLVMADLRELSASRNPHIRLFLGPKIHKTLRAADNLRRQVNDIADQVQRLADFYRQNN